MTRTIKPIWQIVLLAVWINAAEAVRWILYTKPRFDVYFQSKGLVFPNELTNGILWEVWGVIIAVIVYVLSQKYTLLQTTLITWFAAFVLVWIVLWNNAVLPIEILPVVVPLSMITILVAAFIAKKFQPLVSN